MVTPYTGPRQAPPAPPRHRGRYGLWLAACAVGIALAAALYRDAEARLTEGEPLAPCAVAAGRPCRVMTPNGPVDVFYGARGQIGVATAQGGKP